MKNLLKKLVPDFLIGWYHFLWAFLGAVIYGFPSRKIKVIGITGTKGKSTTLYLAGRILEQAGYKVGWISSLSIKIGPKEWLNPYHLTMPGRLFIQKTLKQMTRQGCDYALLEVTSEGIKQHRHQFIDFAAAVLTNLAPEHLEAHRGFANYKRAKGKLFESLKGRGKIIVNSDDTNAQYFLRFPAEQKISFSLDSAVDYQVHEKGIRFIIDQIEFNLKLLGQFNIYNALAAIYLTVSQGVKLETAKEALEKIEKIPGRMEEIHQGQKFRVFVDLAHTPESFEQVFELVSQLPHQRIIAVFGSAGGGRDKQKRPQLAQIAARYSDYIIITNEDPYDENPSRIIKEIEQGLAGFNKYQKIEDRRQAINRALSLAQPDDIVMILGKGTEATLVIGSKKIPWDDRRVVKEELKKILE